MIELRHLIWDDWNAAHIARHGVTPDEVEAACQASPVVYRESYKERLMLLGGSPSGRLLANVVGAVPGAPTGTYSTFTAQPAHRSERRAYQRLKEGTES